MPADGNWEQAIISCCWRRFYAIHQRLKTGMLLSWPPHPTRSTFKFHSQIAKKIQIDGQPWEGQKRTFPLPKIPTLPANYHTSLFFVLLTASPGSPRLACYKRGSRGSFTCSSFIHSSGGEQCFCPFFCERSTR